MIRNKKSIITINFFSLCFFRSLRVGFRDEADLAYAGFAGF
jgi:hypothetical protein